MRVRVPSSSPAWLATFDPPPPPTTPRWRLVPLHPDLAETDYAAFTSCRERLLAELDWNGWPPADFSLADNVADLTAHYAQFERREAYAYSVLDGPRCIGCVYVEPWTTGAQLWFWLIDEALALEAELVTGVLDWLRRWPFDAVVLPVLPDNIRGQRLLAGLGLGRCAGPAGHVSFVRGDPP